MAWVERSHIPYITQWLQRIWRIAHLSTAYLRRSFRHLDSLVGFSSTCRTTNSLVMRTLFVREIFTTPEERTVELMWGQLNKLCATSFAFQNCSQPYLCGSNGFALQAYERKSLEFHKSAYTKGSDIHHKEDRMHFSGTQEGETKWNIDVKTLHLIQMCLTEYDLSW